MSLQTHCLLLPAEHKTQNTKHKTQNTERGECQHGPKQIKTKAGKQANKLA